MLRYINLFPVLWACSGESVIDKQENNAPSIQIMSHSAEAEVLEGYIEGFRAAVSDDDDEFTELSVAWYVGEELVCDWTEASPAGESFCDIVFVPEDSNVIAEVRDPQGAGGRAEISVVVSPTEAPIVTLLSPLQSTNHYSDQLIQFSGLVADNEDSLADLLITWSSSIDGELILDTTPDATGQISDYGYLTEGQHALELRVEDSSGKVTKEQVVIQVGAENAIPTCSITSPEDLTAILLGDSVLFRGTALDANIPATELTALWSSDKDGELGNGTITSSGEVTFSYGELSANEHIISLRVEDEIGAVCQASIVLYVGTPPTVAIDLPSDGEVFSVGETVVFQGTLTDLEDNPSELSASWMSSLDGELLAGAPNSQGVSQFSSASLSAGVHSLTLSVLDTTGLLADDLITFRINTPPPAPAVSLSPDPVYATDTLQAVVVGSADADGDLVSHTYEWYENGVLVAFTTSSIAASELDVGELWTVRVTPNDGYIDGAYAETSITIFNTDPVLSSGLISSSDGADVYNDSVLTCSATASDVDESVSETYTWNINGATYSGASIDLSTVSASVGDTVECAISVLDSNGGEAALTLSETIDNRSPVLTGVAISPSTALSNTLLSCVETASDPDGDSLSTSYEWRVGGVVVGASDQLQLDNSMVSPTDVVECVVTITDSSGVSDQNNASVSVSNSNPSVDSVAIAPTDPSVSDVVTCTAAASDVDGGSPTLSFTFVNQSTSMTYASTASTSSSADLDLSTVTISSGDTLGCQAVASDLNNGTAMAMATVVIAASAPEFTQGAEITPNTGVTTGTTLSCAATAIDPEGGSISYTYTWQVNGQSAGTGTSFLVDAASTNVGDSIGCLVVAIDPDGELTSSTASPVTIENTPPTLGAVTLNTLSPDTNATLTTAGVSQDADGDAVSLRYEWHVIDASNGNANTIVLSGLGSSYSSLSGTLFDRDDEVYVLVTPNDGTDDGNVVESDHATVLNTAPTAPSVALTSASNPPMEGVDDLTCTISNASTDIDLDTITYTYTWTDASGAVQQSNSNTSATQDVFLGSGTTSGTWICEVAASDGSLTTSATAQIVVDSDWAGAVTFTTCGSSGQYGPSQSECDSEYAGSTLSGDVTVLSGIQYWTVPATGTYEIEIAGAQGGTSGGRGVIMSGEFSLSAGDTLKILVGQAGENGSGDGGGGGTFVTDTSNTPLIIAGGGGGRTSYSYSDATTNTCGQTGDGSNPGTGGCSGNGGNGAVSTGNSGGGGLLSDGGSGTYNSTPGIAFVNGGFGGNGSSGNSAGWGGFGGGGGGNDGGHSGGGGGYSGGGGSGNGGSGSGGGGGSYNAGSNQSNGGTNTGSGYVIIDQL